MDWIKIEDEKYPDMNRIHFLADGDSIFIRGTTMQPFFFQLSGEMKPIGKHNYTHYCELPVPPK